MINDSGLSFDDHEATMVSVVDEYNYTTSDYANGNEYNDTVAERNENDQTYSDYNHVYDDEYYLNLYDFEIITLGRVRPIIVLVVALANIFIVSYFMSGKGRGKSTNLLFVSIAFSQTITGIALLPNSFNVYIPGNDILSAVACNTYMVLKLYISMAFHTASIWQTVFLGIQRYLCVCHPLKSGNICTFWKTFVTIIITYMLSFLMHIYKLINAITHKYTHDHNCEWRTDHPCKDVCLYLWICVIFQHFLPVFLLIGLTIQTLMSLHKAQRQASPNISHKAKKIRSSRDRIITFTTALIVVCFLVPEIPYGIYTLFVLINIHSLELAKLELKTHHIMFSAYEIAMLVSFHANFWIYCMMMGDFRRALIHAFTFRCFTRDCVKRRQHCNTYQRTINTSDYPKRLQVLLSLTSIHSTTSDNITAVNEKILLRPIDDQRILPAYCKQPSKEDYNEHFDDVFV
ncbi:sex peptide receptor-like [Dreissena polymorpha]|uniref:G-protein coupled receptors family 1 profile domain-containing protein n=1 Tax=Dreissena polymorpha TaxID=45954 RepID=A0A9D4FZH0_DREPO|nr:sex peptide receptor-like [Dreissena polymorpha]KAH3805976.1 hypothetical protein DPMN_134286 [Dreissena polymorpha]